MIARFVLAAALLVCASAAFAAEPVFLPGSRIGLVPPAALAPSTAMQGFEDRTNRVVLLVGEVAAQTYDKIAEEFSAETVQRFGMEEVSRETMVLPFGDALLLVTRMTQNGAPIQKWAMLARTDDLTVTVIAVVPDSAREIYTDAVMRTAFASIVVRAKLSSDDMLAVLPYRLNELGGFRVLRTSRDGTAVLTLGPNDTTLPVEQPFFMVAPRAVEVPPPAERDQFARLALMSFLNRPNMRITSSEPLRLGGAQWHQMLLESEDEKMKEPLMVVQWLRFGTSGMVQMFGIARKDQWSDVLPRMRALRDGFAAR